MKLNKNIIFLLMIIFLLSFNFIVAKDVNETDLNSKPLELDYENSISIDDAESQNNDVNQINNLQSTNSLNNANKSTEFSLKENDNNILGSANEVKHIYVSPNGNGNGLSENTSGDFITILNDVEDNTIIHMLDGTYSISSSDHIVTISGKNNITIIANNPDKVIIDASVNVDKKYVFNLVNDINFKFENITFTNGGTRTIMRYFSLDSGGDYIFENCKIINITDKVTYVFSFLKENITINNSKLINVASGSYGILYPRNNGNSNVILNNSEFSNNQRAVIMAKNTNSNKFSIDNCEFINNTKWVVNDQSTASDFVFNNCKFINNAKDSILILFSHSAVINKCYFSDNYKDIYPYKSTCSVLINNSIFNKNNKEISISNPDSFITVYGNVSIINSNFTSLLNHTILAYLRAGSLDVFENNTLDHPYAFTYIGQNEEKGTAKFHQMHVTLTFLKGHEDIAMGRNSSVLINATLVDDYGNSIIIPEIKFNVFEQTYTLSYSNGDYKRMITTPNEYMKSNIDVDDDVFNNYPFEYNIIVPDSIVIKSAHNITMNATDMVYGGSANVNVTVSTMESGNITYSIRNSNYDIIKEFTKEFSNNISSAVIDNLDAGTYTLSVTIPETEEYAVTTVSKTLTVNKATNIIVTVDNTTIDKNITVTVIVPGEGSGKITLLRIGRVFAGGGFNNGIRVINNLDVSSGVNTFSFEPLPAQDDYALGFEFKSSSANYNDFSNNAWNNAENRAKLIKFKVSKLDSNLNITADNVDWGNNVTVSITTDSRFTGNITVKLGDEEKLAEIKEGSGSVSFADLKANTYNVTAKFNETDMFTSSQKNINVTVNKVNSTLTLGDDIVFDWNKSGTTTVSYAGATDVNAAIDDRKFEFKDGVITVSGLAAGNYTLSVTTVADENHTSITRTVKVRVNKVNSTLTLGDDIVFDWNKSGTTNVVSYDGATSVEASVDGGVVSVDGNTITVSGLSAGNHTLSVSTVADENHTSITKTVSVKVNKVNATVNLNDIAFDYGSSNSTTFDGEGIKNVTATILNQPDAKIDVSANTITVSGLDAGNYTLEVIVVPDENHNTVTKTVNVTVNKVDSTVDIRNNAVVYDYGDIGYCSIFTEGAVDFAVVIVDHPEAIIKIDEHDIANITGLNAGNYTLKVTTNPDKNHKSVSKTVNVTVNKVDSKLTIPDITFTYGESATVSAVIGNASGIVDVSVVGHPEANVTVNGTSITVSGLTAGTYTLTASTVGDVNYNPVTVNATVTVKGVDVPAAQALSTNVPANSQSPTFSIKLDKDATGNFTVSVDGKVVDTKPLKDGSASITVANLAAGNHKISISYSGDGKYAPITQNTTLTIKAPAVVKKATKIVAKKKTFKAKKKVKKYTITLKSGKTLLKKVKVTLKVKGKTYKATTNNKGKATFKIKNLKKKGTYKAVIKFKGNKNYKASSKKVKIKVKK